MAKINGKNKGSAYERQLCGRFSLWVSNLKRDDVFWRSATSGGRATVRGRFGKSISTQVGDMSCLHPLGQLLLDHFVVEAKFWRRFNLEELIFRQKSPLIPVWKKLLEECGATHRLPLLCIKANILGELVGTTLQGYQMLVQGGNLPLRATIKISGHPDLHLVSMLDLLAYVDFSVLRQKWPARPRAKLQEGDSHALP